jgi:hypothetical protein
MRRNNGRNGFIIVDCANIEYQHQLYMSTIIFLLVLLVGEKAAELGDFVHSKVPRFEP